jgi:beta-glucosidase
MRVRTKAVFVIAVSILGGSLITATFGESAAAGPSQAAWLDAQKPIAARVQALLDVMSLPEKVGQMDQQLIDNVTGPSDCSGSQGWQQVYQPCEKSVLVKNLAGSVLAGGTDNPPDTTGNGGVGNTGFDWAHVYNQVQKYAIKNTPHHIPLIFGVDAVHGFGHPYQAPLFPQSIGMGATWDRSAARAGGVVTANAVRATGWNWVFAPVQDLGRDNRWGRTYETWGEEPALTEAMGAANIRGLQAAGSPHSLKVAATVKHFAGYSQSINGHDRNEALLPLSYLQSVILPSYAGGIDAGADTVMVDSGSINGVPATGSHYLLTDILRDQLHFRGVAISDYQDVQALQTAYHVAPDLAGAIAKAVNAGVDMAMFVNNPDQWQSAIIKDVHSGAISMHRIDQAVGRILALKFRLGLFDQPCVKNPNTPCLNANAANAAVTSGRARTLKAARESMTLLRNENNTMPLSPSAKVVVTGPSADSMTNQLGGWSVSWQGVFGAGHVCCMGPANQIPPGTTVQQGIKNDDPNATYVADGATAAATPADAYVVAVGEKAYAEGLGDNPAPQLPPDQKALIKSLEDTGKPVIVVVIAGRPIGLGPDAENASGILMAYQGSTEAGQAAADAIFGKIDPSGRLSTSWPSDAAAPGADFDGSAASPLGDQPKFFDQLPGTGSGPGHAYNPLYPFGFGLSYTTFTLSDLSVTPSVSRHGIATATFTVTNTGTRRGTDIVPVYVAQPVSRVVVPPQRLVGFIRLSIGPGQSTTARVRFPVATLGETQGDINASGPPTVEPGSYIVQLDKNDTTPYDVALSAPFAIH